MLRHIKWQWGMGFMALLMGSMLPSYATEVIEGYSSYHRVRPMMDVEIIEGDHVLQKPPLPKLYGDVSVNVMPAEAPAFSGLPAFISRYNRQMDPNQVMQISEAIDVYSSAYRLDPKLLTSLVAVESSFRPAAISSSGAIGLGQLKPDTARWLGVADPYDPVQNISGVAKYLRFLLDRYDGSVHHALAAYFQGQGTIDRRGIDEGASRYITKVSQVFNRIAY